MVNQIMHYKPCGIGYNVWSPEAYRCRSAPDFWFARIEDVRKFAKLNGWKAKAI